MKSLSLKWRVSLWVSVVLVAIITTISIVAYVEFIESHLRILDGSLMVMADDIASSVISHQGDEDLQEKVRIITGKPRGNYSVLYRIWMDGSSTDLLASKTPDGKYERWLHELPDQIQPAQEKPVFVNIGQSRDEYRAIWMRKKTDEGTANIILAVSSHQAYHEAYEFQRLLIILGGSLILGSIVAVMWTVRCGLLPICVLTDRLHEISRPNVARTLFDGLKTPEELQPFVEALKSMLARLDKALQQQKQFTSDAAHELRTPLALAKSTLQAAQMNQSDACQYRQMIDEVLDDVARMEHLTDRLLVLARLDETNGQIAEEEVQLDVLLSELAETFGDKMQKSGGKVILDEAPTTTVRGNLDELIDLFGNIIDNATKYGPANGTVRITLEHDSNSHVTVRIHDEGGCIPAADLPHLCDRFYRVDQSRSSSTGGAGLGLAIAREVIRRHNGKISITSNAGSGTLVSVILPRA